MTTTQTDTPPAVDVYIKGTITLNGSTSQFAINGTDGTWQQWGATTRRLGQTVDLLEAMAACILEEG